MAFTEDDAHRYAELCNKRDKTPEEKREAARLYMRAWRDAQPKKPKRELAPCGTVSAYKRHVAERKRARDRGEEPREIDQACRDAWAARWMEHANAGADKPSLYGRTAV